MPTAKTVGSLDHWQVCAFIPEIGTIRWIAGWFQPLYVDPSLKDNLREGDLSFPIHFVCALHP
jgi:hypothetical protein